MMKFKKNRVMYRSWLHENCNLPVHQQEQVGRQGAHADLVDLLDARPVAAEGARVVDEVPQDLRGDGQDEEAGGLQEQLQVGRRTLAWPSSLALHCSTLSLHAQHHHRTRTQAGQQKRDLGVEQAGRHRGPGSVPGPGHVLVVEEVEAVHRPADPDVDEPAHPGQHDVPLERAVDLVMNLHTYRKYYIIV